ncbi:predicted protein [Sclerotinia sclerotiorum 1980 UF-70]|uniref:Uncharacterized protein n=2 Tax=Sclerotinia sclerotiorum (strain ATCC 18683 / 1980 / Ss-1) TaxID=665079 RepID=A7E9E3_SCLS1|nr:predicted protein [Sclerotinia sclerotiorum 1980 UF-70]APA05725.1 hypothetical protein sscle_01g004950 [Sclerotinia sclerotiorum 1980 UF-70]EDN96995.1 predicted protein [Sclerotinia sclerotiorum 1980 UF-70]
MATPDGYQVTVWWLRPSYYPFFIGFPSLPSIFKASLSQFNFTDISCNSLTGTYIRPDEVRCHVIQTSFQEPDGTETSMQFPVSRVMAAIHRYMVNCLSRPS